MRLADAEFWLASYPRSGNTLLRMILRQAFEIGSRSIYRERSLAEFTRSLIADEGPAIKTHGLPMPGRAIYVVRDGREVCASLWCYLRDCMGVDLPMADVILGRHRFGRWCDHLAAWRPDTRPQTLLVHYESLTEPGTISRIGEWLGERPNDADLPSFDDLHAADPRMFRAGTNETWRGLMTDGDLDLFDRINGEAMERFGYVSRKAAA